MFDWYPGSHQHLFDECLLKINKELSYVQCELRGFRSQYDGRVYYGVVNNISDQQSKLGTRYSVPQIAFYKAIVSLLLHFFFFFGFLWVMLKLAEKWKDLCYILPMRIFVVESHIARVLLGCALYKSWAILHLQGLFWVELGLFVFLLLLCL